MKRFLISVVGVLLMALPLSADSFSEKAQKAVALLFSQTEAGGMQMHCTATAFEKTTKGYLFATAAHCIGNDRTDKEKTASTLNIPFYVSFDEAGSEKRFWRADAKWAGYQSRGDDFAVFEVTTAETWETVPLGDEKKLKDGAEYWNIASPLGLGVQVQEGRIAKLKLDRPIVQGSINWGGTLVLQQSGVNGGSSGSALISKEQQAIVGFLVGTIGEQTIIGIPVSRFVAVSKAVAAKKYKWFVPEEHINADGSVEGGQLLFTLKFGCVSVQVESPELESTLEHVADEVDAIEGRLVDQELMLLELLDAVEGTPHVEFTVGPVVEQR